MVHHKTSASTHFPLGNLFRPTHHQGQRINVKRDRDRIAENKITTKYDDDDEKEEDEDENGDADRRFTIEQNPNHTHTHYTINIYVFLFSVGIFFPLLVHFAYLVALFIVRTFLNIDTLTYAHTHWPKWQWQHQATEFVVHKLLSDRIN